MKKIFFIVTFLFCCMQLYAQDITNGDFSTNNGNDAIIFGLPTFSNTSVPNWKRSFGAPRFNTGYIYNGDCYPLVTTSITSSGIVLDADGGLGSGIVGGYSFVAGETYFVSIFCAPNQGDPTEINLNVYATATEPISNVISGACVDVSGGPLPSAGTTQEIGVTPMGYYNIHTFSITPNTNYSYIWIYASNNTCSVSNGSTLPSCNGHTIAHNFDINQVMIQKCQSDFYIATSPLPNLYSYADNIYVGSYYGTSPEVKINSGLTSLSTQIIAKGQVTITNNFTASSSSWLYPDDRYFAVGINPAACDVIPSGGYSSRMTQQADSTKSDTLSNNLSVTNIDNIVSNSYSFIISPNPTSSSVTIEPIGDVTYPLMILVNDVAGKTIMKKQFTNSKMKIDLGEFAPGLYLFNIQSSSGINTYKVTKY